MERLRIALLLVGLALAACGAPPESRVALSEPGTAAFDPRLAGRWYAGDGRSAYYLEITPLKEDRMLDVVVTAVGYRNDDPVRWLRATAFATDVDGVTYYNLKRVSGAGFDYTAEGEAPGYIFVTAELRAGDDLYLCFFGGFFGEKLDKLARDDRIEAREVKGKSMGEKVAYLILAQPRAALVELIRGVPRDELFDCLDGGSFIRLQSSTKRSD